MRERPFIAVYIMASGRLGTLYTGVTSNPWQRVLEHQKGQADGFSKKHGCTGLVWFERFVSLPPAFERETRIKGWRRRRKLDPDREVQPGLVRPRRGLVRRDY